MNRKQGVLHRVYDALVEARMRRAACEVALYRDIHEVGPVRKSR